MSTGLKTPVDCDLAACIGDETVARELVAEAMREDGFLPPKLPEWQHTQEEKPQPVIEHRDILDITPHTRMTVTQEKYGGGSFWIYFSGYGDWPQEGGAEERRNATLRFVLAEAERALPVLRAMVQNIEEAAE